ncbi:MAG: polymer-forming cytoskeletal protein [Patescibacteria group bacterium]|nr:polymer-forming cytoskeletal protein [Patescibacteria group bacterium]
MFKENKPKPITDGETIIGQGVRVEGNFVGEGNVIVRGQVKGSITTKNDLKVEEGAFIEADVVAQNVIIAGEIKGNVKATETVKLINSAKVLGNIECQSLSVEEGVVFNGQCVMGTKKIVEE